MLRTVCSEPDQAFRPLGEAEVRRLLQEEWRQFAVLLPEGGVRLVARIRSYYPAGAKVTR